MRVAREVFSLQIEQAHYRSLPLSKLYLVGLKKNFNPPSTRKSSIEGLIEGLFKTASESGQFCASGFT